MKKQLLTIVLLAFLSANGFMANAQLTNGNLETWMNFQIYEDPDTNGIIKSLNKIAIFGGNPPITCFKDASAHSGSFCARIEAKMYGTSIFIPGVLGTVKPFFQPVIGCDLQAPFVGRPAKLSTWIKYAPVQGDSGEVFAYMLKQNGSNFETLGVAKQKFLQPVANWTNYTLDFTYTGAPDASTHMSLIFVTSKAYDFSDLTNCQGKVNSTMWIDDIELIGVAGVSEMLFTGEEINVYPNPSENIVNISVTQNLKNAVLSVTDMNGREISTQNVSGNQFTLDVNTLKAGNYVVVLKENNTILGRKTFVKK
jgi:hypothetical protein